MPLSIRAIYQRAEAFRANNPDLAAAMTAQEIRHLIALGAVDRAPVPVIRDPAMIDRWRAAIAQFDAPFTSAELAAAVCAPDAPSSMMLRQAGQAAREILGAGPRKSNGRQVFDPAPFSR